MLLLFSLKAPLTVQMCSLTKKWYVVQLILLTYPFMYFHGITNKCVHKWFAFQCGLSTDTLTNLSRSISICYQKNIITIRRKHIILFYSGRLPNAYVIHSNPITHIFLLKSKSLVEGIGHVGWNSTILILPIIKI